jgi:hypothetical protein
MHAQKNRIRNIRQVSSVVFREGVDWSNVLSGSVRLSTILFLFCSIVCAWTQDRNAVEGMDGTARKSCVRLLNHPVVTVNQVTGTGEAIIYLRNETDKQVALGLIGTIKAPLNSPVVAKFIGDSTNDNGSVYERLLPPKTVVPLHLVVQDVWEDGEFDIEVTNHYGTEVSGKVHVRRFPVSVKLDGTERLKLGLLDGMPMRLSLRNDDPVYYPVAWKVVDGEEVCGGSTVLTPKAATLLECTPRVPWHWSRMSNLMKQDINRDGYRLVLLPQAANAGTRDSAEHPLKTFSAEASLDYFGSLVRALSSYTLLVLLLIAGGLSSLMLSYLLPNKLARLDLRDKLLDLASRTADLSTRIDSRLAVLVRLERSRLTDLLRSRSVLSPDFATIAAQCTNGINRLASKVTVLEKMDVVLGRLARQLATGVPPTLVDEVNAYLQDAAVMLGKGEVTDTDVQAAAANVEVASSHVDQLGGPNDEFGRKLADSVRQLLADLSAGVGVSPTYLAVASQLSGPNAALRMVNPVTHVIAPEKYLEIDIALHKTQIMRDYVLLEDGISDQQVKTRLRERQAQLISLLQPQSWDGLRSARLLLHEMQDDVFPERLLEAVRNPGDISIEMDPSIAYEQAPLEFCVCFHKSALNTSAAREELGVEWNFGDGLKEKGWTVSHYFQLKTRVDSYVVQARFHDPDGEIVVNNSGEPITIQRTVKINRSEIGRGVGERTRTEFLKLAAALLIAVFGLVSGAQEQISKLDILPGLIAVFLLGFSADSIKRLLTTAKA